MAARELVQVSWSSSRVKGELYLTSSFTIKMYDAMDSKVLDANTGDGTSSIGNIDPDGPCQKL